MLPIAIIGAGPIGLSIAARLVKLKEPFIVLEKGTHVGNNISEWQHVKMFSPWKYNLDEVAAKLLRNTYWEMPDLEVTPTGKEFLQNYLSPLSNLSCINPYIMLNAEVIEVKANKENSANSYSVSYFSEHILESIKCKAIIDTSGTFNSPNRLGLNGEYAIGEKKLDKNVFYKIPTYSDLNKLKGKRIAVVGAGHSAMQSLITLANLKKENRETEIIWITRQPHWKNYFKSKPSDHLSEREKLKNTTHNLIDSDFIKPYDGFQILELAVSNNTITIIGTKINNKAIIKDIDYIICNTGYGPDYTFYKNIPLSIDKNILAVTTIASFIDPTKHTCGSIDANNVLQLQQPNEKIFIAGMKSFGKAPNFLLRTGYKQADAVIEDLKTLYTVSITINYAK